MKSDTMALTSCSSQIFRFADLRDQYAKSWSGQVVSPIHWVKYFRINVFKLRLYDLSDSNTLMIFPEIPVLSISRIASCPSP